MFTFLSVILVYSLGLVRVLRVSITVTLLHVILFILLYSLGLVRVFRVSVTVTFLHIIYSFYFTH